MSALPIATWKDSPFSLFEEPDDGVVLLLPSVRGICGSGGRARKECEADVVDVNEIDRLPPALER